MHCCVARACSPRAAISTLTGHGGPVRGWHAYTGAQIERAIELAEAAG